jgi:hypothetical protein
MKWVQTTWNITEYIGNMHITNMNPNSIARTVLNGYVISTVKLAGAENYPDLFAGHMYETLVFRADSDGTVTDWLEVDSLQYATEDAAHLGHAALVAMWKVTVCRDDDSIVTEL